MKNTTFTYPALPLARRDKLVLILSMLGLFGALFVGVFALDAFASFGMILLFSVIFGFQGSLMLGLGFGRSMSARRLVFLALVGQDAEQKVLEETGDKVWGSLVLGAGLSIVVVGLIGLLVTLDDPGVSLTDSIQQLTRDSAPEVIDAQNPPSTWPVGLVRLRQVNTITSTQAGTVVHHTLREGKQRQTFDRERWLDRLHLPGAGPLLVRFDCFVEGCQPPWRSNTTITELSGLIVPNARRAWGDGISDDDADRPLFLVGESAKIFNKTLLFGVLLIVVPIIAVGGVAFYWRVIAFPARPQPQTGEKSPTPIPNPSKTPDRASSPPIDSLLPKPTPPTPPMQPTNPKKNKRNKRKQK